MPSALGVELPELSHDDTGEQFGIGEEGLGGVWTTPDRSEDVDDLLQAIADKQEDGDKKSIGVLLKEVKLLTRFHGAVPRIR
jgi:hypothetical protein